MKIGQYDLENLPFFLIAEAGINHNGSMDNAKTLIRIAKESGAHCVKFQKRNVDRILTKQGLLRPYQNSNSFGDTYGEHKRYLELSFEQFRELKSYANKIGILFAASGWDEDSVDFLDSLDVPFFKMASADLTNFPLLIHTARKGRPIIISTGMANMETVQKAYNLIKQYNKKIAILQCTSSYPAPNDQINLNVIPTYIKDFPDAVIGYSGHEKGIAISLAAFMKGARIIERHFTIDRTMRGGDHACSLEEIGLKKLVRDLNIVHCALGSSNKQIQPSEYQCFKKLTKSVVSAVSIPRETTITREMITVKGPGVTDENDGISPMNFENVIGKKTNVDIEEDILIKNSWLT